MTEETFDVGDALSAAKRPQLVLTGGEPLLRDNIEAIAASASAAGRRVGLGTSGALIRPLLRRSSGPQA